MRWSGAWCGPWDGAWDAAASWGSVVQLDPSGVVAIPSDVDPSGVVAIPSDVDPSGVAPSSAVQVS